MTQTPLGPSGFQVEPLEYDSLVETGKLEVEKIPLDIPGFTVAQVGDAVRIQKPVDGQLNEGVQARIEAIEDIGMGTRKKITLSLL